MRTDIKPKGEKGAGKKEKGKQIPVCMFQWLLGFPSATPHSWLRRDKRSSRWPRLLLPRPGAGEGNEGGNGDKMRSTSQALGAGINSHDEKNLQTVERAPNT